VNLLKQIAIPKRQKRDNQCKKCGIVFSKKDIPVSGWKDDNYGLHQHCPNCNAIIDYQLKERILIN
jgi:hypothetical protein